MSKKKSPLSDLPAPKAKLPEGAKCEKCENPGFRQEEETFVCKNCGHEQTSF